MQSPAGSGNLVLSSLSGKIPLTATLEFQLELWQIYNVDLFDKGFYHVKISVLDDNNLSSDSPGADLPVNQESNPKTDSSSKQVDVDPFNIFLSSASVIRRNNTEVDKKYEQEVSTDVITIAYKREHVALNEIFLFRVSKLINAASLEQDLQKISVPFLFSLYWEESNNNFESANAATCVSQRVLNIDWNAETGTHVYTTVSFEYANAATLELVVHSSLTSLLQPDSSQLAKLYKAESNNLPVPTLEDVLFTGLGGRLSSPEQINSYESDQLISLANKSHVCIISCMNRAFEILYDFLVDAVDFKDKSMDFKEMIDKIASHVDISKAMDQANKNIAEANTLLLKRWVQFQDRVRLSSTLKKAYKKEYFRSKVERYSRGHIILNNYLNPDVSHVNRYTDKEVVYQKMAECLRKSSHYTGMPSLDARCQEIDVSGEQQVVILEDLYNPDTIKSIDRNQSTISINSAQQRFSIEKLQLEDEEKIVNGGSELTKDHPNVQLLKFTKIVSNISEPDASLRNSLNSISNSICSGDKNGTGLDCSWALATEIDRKIEVIPYFPFRQQQVNDPTHLIICAHGLEGSACDLRLFRSWIERTVLNTGQRISWLMSSANYEKTFDDIEKQGQRLAKEVLEQIKVLKIQNRDPMKISWIGHSMGALVAKQAADDDSLKDYRNKFHTYCSLF